MWEVMGMNSMSYETSNITSSNRILHTPSDFARKNLLYIQEVGKLKSLKPHVSKRSELESYLFFIVLKGAGSVAINDTKYNVSVGDCVLINCMDAYEHISSEDNPWELAWVHFNGVNAEAYYEMFTKKNRGIPYYHAENSRKYEEIINKIMDNQSGKDVVSELVTSLALTELLTLLLQDLIALEEHHGEYNLSKIREIINERFREENLFEKICQEYGFDEMTINMQYKNKYGIDLCDYILNRRFTCAKELLRFTVKPVKEVVMESGIGNADLFRHMFIENEGMTADEYRKKWSQWNRG